MTLADCIADGRGWRPPGGKPVTALGELPSLLAFVRRELLRHVATDPDLVGLDAAAVLQHLGRAKDAADEMVVAAEEQAA